MFNGGKTHTLLIGHDRNLLDCSLEKNFLTPSLKSQVQNLGLKIDTQLNMDGRINYMAKLCFFQIRCIAKLKPILSKRQFENIIHALITSRLDYCNASLFGVN